AEDFTNYTVFSLWDTFRGLHPLFTIIDQERTGDFIRSLLIKYEQGGRLPMWPLAANYTDDMLGYHAVPVIVDAYMKGIRDYDAEKAFTACKHIAELDRLGLKYYKKLGYIPYERQGESVSKTLEYCYDDWCIARMAKELGKETDHLRFHQRAHFYENVFDSSTNFMRGRAISGDWYDPFDPLVNSAYSEGNAYQYLFVPHDIEGIIDLMGGEREFSMWLDTLFSLSHGANEAGAIGQYEHGNEPSHHLAYLYNYTGEAWKTQKLVNRILTRFYSDSPDGLAGNEDCGQMSAWYILSSMGFYSVSPGQNIYPIGSPLFDKVTVHLENGNTFVVEAKNISPENIYIQSATLNGEPFP
ncbi:MAG: glycoside hydrolase family 92 protein, partial [Bacteroidales bacterium]|nr:glycoside hydrolase family 92 protein [Bacteroidales bacterium]